MTHRYDVDRLLGIDHASKSVIDRDQLWAALWECFLASGADPSGYTHETRTPEGRRAGLIDFVSRAEPGRAVEAVRELRADYDQACCER